MARQPTSTNKPQETIQTLSRQELEDIPDTDGGLTEAAAAAVPATVDKGLSAGALEQLEKEGAGEEVPRPQRYRVKADRYVTNNGNRTLLRTGKELDSSQYNIAHLKNQGVQLEELSDGE